MQPREQGRANEDISCATADALSIDFCPKPRERRKWVAAWLASSPARGYSSPTKTLKAAYAATGSTVIFALE